MKMVAVEGVTIIEGEEKGEALTIMVGVHGNEVGGILALKEIIPQLHIKRGVVHFILGNPRAIEKNVRFIDENLNRLFVAENKLNEQQKKSYERKRAIELIPYLRESKALLDLHASASVHTTPFLICESHSFEIAKKLPFSIRSSGWDVLEPGGADWFMNQNGGSGICAECGFLNDPQSKNVASQAIYAFLSFFGAIENLPGELNIKKQREIFVNYIYKTHENFTPQKDFKDFDLVKKEQPIGSDGRKVIVAPEDGVVIFVRKREKPNEEAFLFGTEKNNSKKY